MYALDKHIDTIKEFNVSISGSLDLPLSLHDEYRVTKGGMGTFNKILDNIKHLAVFYIGRYLLPKRVFF